MMNGYNVLFRIGKWFLAVERYRIFIGRVNKNQSYSSWTLFNSGEEIMTEEKDKCDTCEHQGDSSNEYCGSCGGGVESNWKEAGWSKDKTINELRTRVADLELCNKNANALIADQADESQRIVDKLQTRLSTLLKASEGMEKALEMLYSELVESNSPRCDEWSTPAKIIKQALADFRAVKENMEKGAGK